MTALARFAARGHPAIRASHAKTLELTAEPAITARASCMVGVAAALPAQPVAGPIRLTLSVAGESVSFSATGNSAWWPGSGSAVIRRSGRRLPDSYATGAGLAAADLPRSMVRALTDPDATVTVLVERDSGPADGTLVRCRVAGTGPDRLLAEIDAADLVLIEDAAARSWLASAGIPVPAGKAAQLSAVQACLAGGGRLLAIAAGDGADPSEPLAAAGSVEVLGLPAGQAVSAAAPDRSPALDAAGVRLRELPALAAAYPALALVFRCPAERLAGLLAELGRHRAAVTVARMDDPERPLRAELDDLALPGWLELPRRGELACRVAGIGPPAGGPAIEPAELVRQLLGRAVTPRTVALAVAALPGWSRRSAYEFVLALSGDPSVSSAPD